METRFDGKPLLSSSIDMVENFCLTGTVELVPSPTGHGCP